MDLARKLAVLESCNCEEYGIKRGYRKKLNAYKVSFWKTFYIVIILIRAVRKFFDLYEYYDLHVRSWCT